MAKLEKKSMSSPDEAVLHEAVLREAVCLLQLVKSE
jgi:hypothetical protein